MADDPSIETRDALHYAAVRTTLAMSELGEQLPQHWPAVAMWLAEREIALVGAPFIRYRRIDMPDRMEIDVGIPIPGPGVQGDDSIVIDSLPAGRYAVLHHIGSFDGLLESNARLQDWGADQGHAFASQHSAAEEVWEARTESYLTDPDDEPDPAKWVTELAYLLKD